MDEVATTPEKNEAGGEFDYGEEFFIANSDVDKNLDTVEKHSTDIGQEKPDSEVIQDETTTENVLPVQGFAVGSSASPGSKYQTECSGSDDELTKAKAEWDNVQEIIVATPGDSVMNEEFQKLMTLTEVLDHFRSMNLKSYNDKIQPTINHTGLSSIWYAITGPPRLPKHLRQDRDFIFTLALIAFDNSDEIHSQILQTLYKELTNSKFDCQRYGSHWEVIGFQGNDPATDLRGCGMLGLITTLWFVTSHKTAQIACSVYQLSQDEIQNFPFCVMSINVTRIALQILREGKLNKECIRQTKDNIRKHYTIFQNYVTDVFLEFYAAIFCYIYLTWKMEHKTMAESGFVMKDVEEFAKKKPQELIKFYNQQLQKHQQSKIVKNDDEKIDSFVGIEDLP